MGIAAIRTLVLRVVISVIAAVAVVLALFAS